MKKLVSLFLLGLLAFLNSSAFATTLKKGTTVTIKNPETISAENLSVGDSVNFIVAKNVQDSFGNIVLAQNTKVSATVTNVRPMERIGKSARIYLDNFTTKDTNGTKVDLSGSVSVVPKSRMARSIVLSVVIIPFFLLMHGASAEIPANSEYTLTVK